MAHYPSRMHAPELENIISRAPEAGGRRGSIGDTISKKSIVHDFGLIFHDFSRFCYFYYHIGLHIRLTTHHAGMSQSSKTSFPDRQRPGDVGDQQEKQFAESQKIMIFDSFFMIFMIFGLPARSNCRFD